MEGCGRDVLAGVVEWEVLCLSKLPPPIFSALISCNVLANANGAVVTFDVSVNAPSSTEETER